MLDFKDAQMHKHAQARGSKILEYTPEVLIEYIVMINYNVTMLG